MIALGQKQNNVVSWAKFQKMLPNVLQTFMARFNPG